MDRLAGFYAAQNYAVYYGSGMTEELSQFDLVIVEPEGQSEASVRLMQQSGALVLAYLSVMEIPPAAPEVKFFRRTDFLSKEGCLMTNPVYGNLLADLRSKRWMGLLFQKAGRLVTQGGYDGLFLDTIGNVEDKGIPGNLRDLQLMAAVDIVREMRKRFPLHIIVQNSGLEKLCMFTSAYINGICWENPPLTEKIRKPYTEAIVNRLAGLRKQYGIKILMLSEDKEPAGNCICKVEPDSFRYARELIEQRGFLWYRAPYNYVSGINLTS